MSERHNIYSNLLYDKNFERLTTKQKSKVRKLQRKSKPSLVKGAKYVSSLYPGKILVYAGKADEHTWGFDSYKGKKKLGYQAMFDYYGLKLLKRR